jgi:16S rRNA (adenine1518-N6/adenine1519-N6)-dimethyltransferase
MVIPRKRFGQNFLVDPRVIERIIRSVDPRPGDRILEIGPGQGALTGALVSSGCDLSLVEIDRDLAELLNKKFPGVSLLREDVLKADLSALLENGQYRIVGNLPYNISTPLLFRLFKQADLIRDMHFMLQLEVVDRMIAAPDSKTYGRLSVMTQLYCHAEKLFDVPPDAFSPRPKVRSAIVQLTPIEPAERLTVSPDALEKLLIQAFSARRKTLRNAFRGLLSESQLQSLDINPQLRPENLTVTQFAACASLIEGASG